MESLDNLLNATMTDMRRGYKEFAEGFECLICGYRTERGVIYPQESLFYDAEKAMKRHIQKEHGSVFHVLIGMDKKVTGLSEHQSTLLKLFYQGKSDLEIQKEVGAGSSSTIRNHRFILREKERQAKVFLTVMEILKEDKKAPALVAPHKTATMVDDRYNVTEDENADILKKYFPHGPEGSLNTFSMKEKHKIAVIRQLVKRFDPERTYTEKQVNVILKDAFHDFATIRRYMIEYGLMDRKPNGSSYWVKKENLADASRNDEIGGENAGKKGADMDRRRELMEQFKQVKKEAGAYQIRNKVNGRILVLVAPDLKSMNGKRFELKMGSMLNKELQMEWNTYGEEAFEFEVLEVIKDDDVDFYDKKGMLKKLERKWLDQLQPYGERGYNRKKAEG